jgi:hypothetical protein
MWPEDDIRKRLGRSTDTADAVAMACWHNPGVAKDPPEIGTKRNLAQRLFEAR